MSDNDLDWARKALNALANNDTSGKEEAVSHISDSFHIRHTWFYKFEDDSYLKIEVRGAYTNLYIIDNEKYEKKKKEYTKWAESVNLQKVDP